MKKFKKNIPEAIFLLLSFVYFFCFLNFAAKEKKHATAEDFVDELEIVQEEIVYSPDIWTENPEEYHFILNDVVHPGDPVTVVFLPEIKNGEVQIKDKKFTVTLFDEDNKRLSRASFFEWECDSYGHKINTAVFTVPSTQGKGEKLVKIEGDSGFVVDFMLTVASRDFESEVIALNKELTDIRTTTDPKRNSEAQRLWATLSKNGTEVYTNDVFSTPIKRDTRRTSFFGDKRIYRYANGKTDSAVHAGIDYGIPTGTEVRVAANGLVVIATPRIVTGNSVVVEHLPGVYSLYYHLDQILVKEGDMLQAGDLIGLSGATGLATGPHLHWEIRCATENTDPDFVSTFPLLDTEALFEKFDVNDFSQNDETEIKTTLQKEVTDQEENTKTSIEVLESANNTVKPIIKHDKWTDNNAPFFELLHEDLRPGDPVSVVFYPEMSNGKSKIEDETFKISLYNSANTRISRADFFKWKCDAEEHIINAAVFAIPSTQNPCEAKIKIEGDKGFTAEKTIKIGARIFEIDLVTLSPALTAMRTQSDPQKTAEAQRLWAIYATTGNTIYTTGPFTTPLARDTRRTSPFGDKRVYKYANGTTDNAIHAGIDYGVPTGTNITNTAGGRVVLARPRIVTGNSVIIEHLPGVYSIYYHLDEILVAENSIVETGTIIGKSGSTGLSTGPHLHWEIRVSGENTNPDTISDIPLLDNERLAKKLQELENRY
jgi:murein DD-endopeptidase MepM/ murein hydrolase activator NlpD